MNTIKFLAHSHKTHSKRLNSVHRMAGIRPNRRIPMLYRSRRISAGEPSFFYLMLAVSCFRRAAGTDHPKGSSTLRKIGRNYLVNATCVASVLEPQPPRILP